MNPLDEYLAEKGDLDKVGEVRINLGGIPAPPLNQTQQKEIDLWNSWNSGGRKPTDLRPLLKSIQPLVQKQVNVYAGRVKFVPQATIEAEFKNHAVKAIKSFDPSRGAKLGTWVNTNLRKGGRFVKTYQNVGRIVEERQSLITPFNNMREELTDQLGRSPTDTEMLVGLNKSGPKKWNMSEIQKMNSELRADVLSSAFESDPHTWVPTADEEIMSHLGEVLSPDEQKVFKYIQTPGATQGKTGLIAQKLKWSPSKVSRLRKTILQKALKYKSLLEG